MFHNYEGGKKLDEIEKKVDGKAVKHNGVSKHYWFIIEVHMHSSEAQSKPNGNAAQKNVVQCKQKLSYSLPIFFQDAQLIVQDGEWKIQRLILKLTQNYASLNVNT